MLRDILFNYSSILRAARFLIIMNICLLHWLNFQINTNKADIVFEQPF